MYKSVKDDRVKLLEELRSERNYLASLKSSDEDILDEIDRYDDVIYNLEFEIGMDGIKNSLI